MLKRVLDDEVILSWRRCQEKGLSSDIPYPNIIIRDKQLIKIINENKNLIKIFNDSIKKIMKNIKKDIFILLTDKDTILIEYHCSPDLLSTLERIRFKKGISFKEESCGTNAISLAYRYKKPMYLLPYQHYCKILKNWYCYASPIHVDNEIIGYIDITTIDKHLKNEMKCIADLLVEIISSRFPYVRNQDMLKRRYMLGDRHIEILNMMSQGMTTKEISEKLFLSVNTIKYHKKTIQKAFDAKNSNEVLAKAYSEGLIKK